MPISPDAGVLVDAGTVSEMSECSPKPDDGIFLETAPDTYVLEVSGSEDCVEHRLTLSVSVRPPSVTSEITTTRAEWTLLMCNRCSAPIDINWVAFENEGGINMRNSRANLAGAHLPIGVVDGSGRMALPCPIAADVEWCTELGPTSELVPFSYTAAPEQVVQISARSHELPVFYDWRQEAFDWTFGDEWWLVPPSPNPQTVDYADQLSLVYALPRAGRFVLYDACAAAEYPIPARCGFDTLAPREISLKTVGPLVLPDSIMDAISQRIAR